jgi:hypothetical protein
MKENQPEFPISILSLRNTIRPPPSRVNLKSPWPQSFRFWQVVNFFDQFNEPLSVILGSRFFTE